MNTLRSLEQKRANFSYNTLEQIVNLRNVDDCNRLNGLLKIVFNDVSLTKDEFEDLRTEKDKKKEIFDKKFQKSFEEKLSSYISKAPTMILVNGLGNTMVYYLSKMGITPDKLLEDIKEFKKKYVEKNENVDRLKKSILEHLKPDKFAYLIIYTAINKWLKGMGIIDKDIMEWFKDENVSSIDVLHATREALEMLRWLRRFADAMLGEGEE